MVNVRIFSLMILVLLTSPAAVVDAAPAFIGYGHGHGRGGQCTRTSSSKGSAPVHRSLPSRVPVGVPFSLIRTQAADKDDEDDGWGNDDDSSSSSSSVTAQKGNQPTANSGERSRASTTKPSAPEERDLFIPIFSLISLAGLFGSYGYEMLRLYFRGELYLPWDHK
jgi:hypothetical protein